MPVIPNDDGTDTYALKKKYITVTPIHCDLTDYPFLSDLKANPALYRIWSSFITPSPPAIFIFFAYIFLKSLYNKKEINRKAYNDGLASADP